MAVGTVLQKDGRVLTSLSALGGIEQPEIRYADNSVVKTKIGHKDRAWDLALLIPQSGKWIDGLMPTDADPSGQELKAFLPPEAVDGLTGQALIVPLRLTGQVAGAMLLADRAGGEAFVPEELQILTGMAASASVALARARPDGPGQPAAARREAEGEPGEARLETLLRHEVHRGLRYRRQFCLLLIGWGGAEAASSEMSASMCRRMARTVREADLMVPLAGPAAAIIAPETDYLGGLGLARRINRALLRTAGRAGESPLAPLDTGIAAFPDHGATASALLARARAGLVRSRQMPYLLEGLWEFVDRLTVEAPPGDLPAGRAEGAGELPGGGAEGGPGFPGAGASLPEAERIAGDGGEPMAEEALKQGLRAVPSRDDFEATARAVEEALASHPPSGGVLYVGVGRLSQLQAYLDLYMTVQQRGIEVFVFGEDDWVGWDPERLTPVVTRDGEIGRRRFVLFYGLDACYALVGTETADGGLRGFYTTNPLLVNTLITKVKARYL